MTTTPAPSQFFNNTGLPRGTRTVAMLRMAAPPVIGGSDTALGNYIVETDNFRRPSTLVQRRNTNNEPLDWSGVTDFESMTFTAQLSTSTTATLRTGDYFVTAGPDINMDGTGSGNTGATSNNERWIITEVSNPESQGEARKQTGTAHKDYSYTG